MNDDYIIKRITKWLESELPRDAMPGAIELRAGGEVIDAFEISASADVSSIARDAVESAHDDASGEGRSRNYSLMAVLAGDMHYPCPVSIRCRKGNKAVDSIAKMMTETCSMLLKFSERLDASHRRMAEDNERNAARASELITRLEDLRSKQLERDMLKEKHDKDIEIRERITDAVVPLAVAIGSKLTKGALPAPSTDDVLLVQTVKSMTEDQLELIKKITGPLWPSFDRVISMGLEGAADVKGFKEAAGKLSSEQLMALTQCLNVGQQAALDELFNGRPNGANGSH